MRLLFTHEVHAVSVNGRYYNATGALGYDNLLNYVSHVPEAVVILRHAGPAATAKEGWIRIDGPAISVQPIPDIRSFSQLIRAWPAIWRSVSAALRVTDCTVLRLPGACGVPVGLVLLARNRRYGVEFVGHPTESVREILQKQGRRRPMLVWMIDSLNKLLLRRAVAVAYRSRYLQRAFPSGHASQEVVFSGAQLHKEFITAPRPEAHFRTRPFRIISTGRLMPEKGHHVLLDAFARARELTEVPLVLRLVGDGASLSELQARARALGVAADVEFTGRVPWGAALFAQMDDAHLYVLPSLTEGMPRSLIEAMARGMPALGSRCGGIPELLPSEDLIPPGEVEPLARKIASLASDPVRLAQMSRRNFDASREHWPERLGAAKACFWDLVMRKGR